MADLKIPVLKPSLPAADALLPYLREIDRNHWYSNFGPLVRRFEGRVAAHFSVQPDNVLTMANGTVALSVALRAVARPGRRRCLVPSWTFCASPAAVLAAGLEVHFIDVNPVTWSIEPSALAARDDLDDVAAVIVVAPFGAPVRQADWDAFTAETGVPVVIDAAAGFDSLASCPSARAGRSPVMVSLHATKSFGIGEGGLLVTTDPGIAARMRSLGNFGFVGSPEAVEMGWNAKLSEYHAAVGLAMLDMWPERRAELQRITDLWIDALKDVPGIHYSPGYGEGWVASYCCVQSDAGSDQLEATLAAAGIETRRWWRNGSHRQSAFARCSRDPLPVTEQLAASVIGLPFYPGITKAEIELIAATLRVAL